MSESVTSISPKELANNLQQQNVSIIDVRTPAEFREVHLKTAKNIPLDKLGPDVLKVEGKEQDLYVICKSGSRGKIAVERLSQLGFTRVCNVEGGTEACIAAGLDVERGKKSMSIERQVRIVAGLIVLVGAILALTVSTSFAIIPAFVGAGLMFAGITDTCGMALLLGKCPWNQ